MPVTPTRLREIAYAARRLAAAIGRAQEDLRASTDEYVRRSGFRLDEAAGQARAAERELNATSGDLDRFCARPADACQVPWGVCPGHGRALTGSGGRTRCEQCGRTWDYDRIGMPCEEHAAWLLTDSGGATGRVCDSHARDARANLDGARLSPLAPADHGEENKP